jgi:PLD-like domain
VRELSGRRSRAAVALCVASVALAASPSSAENGEEVSVSAAGLPSQVTYETFFTAGDSVDDTTLENVVSDLLNNAPAGSQVHVAMYQWTRLTDPFINAHRRGVDIRFIIGKDSRNSAAVTRLRNNIPASRFTFCGLSLVTDACLNVDTSLPHINHNKFFLFSALNDGSANVVVQSSSNLTGPMLNDHNNLVIVRNDKALYDGYLAFWNDMRGQQRVADYGRRWTGESTTLITFNRPDLTGDQEDPLVEALAGLTCSEGGAPDGKGLVRIAHSSFVASRVGVARQLARLKRAGCTVEVLAAAIDAEPAAVFNNAGIPALARRDPGGLHSKIMLADTTDANGVRRQVIWTGSHTMDWASLHGNDETVLRIEDAGVFAAFNADWEGLRSRTIPIPYTPPATDEDGPYADLYASPEPNENGWHHGDMTLQLAAMDGFRNNGGVREIVVTLSGAHEGIEIVPGDRATLTLSNEGVTEVGWYAVDVFGNDQSACPHPPGSPFLPLERPCFPPGSLTVLIDKTAPALVGLPRDCVLWPPNHKLVHVATVSAEDGLSGVRDLSVSATSSEIEDAPGDGDTAPDIVIGSGDVQLRAERSGSGDGRTYTVTASATDAADNLITGTFQCFVPQSH